MKKIPARKPAARKNPAQRDALLHITAQTQKHLNYRNYPDGNMRLFNGSTDTGVAVKRSHEGYSHFARWYVTDGDKIKKDFSINEKESALAKGISLYLEKLSNEMLKKHGRGEDG